MEAPAPTRVGPPTLFRGGEIVAPQFSRGGSPSIRRIPRTPRPRLPFIIPTLSISALANPYRRRDFAPLSAVPSPSPSPSPAPPSPSPAAATSLRASRSKAATPSESSQKPAKRKPHADAEPSNPRFGKKRAACRGARPAVEIPPPVADVPVQVSRREDSPSGDPSRLTQVNVLCYF